MGDDKGKSKRDAKVVGRKGRRGGEACSECAASKAVRNKKRQAMPSRSLKQITAEAKINRVASRGDSLPKSEEYMLTSNAQSIDGQHTSDNPPLPTRQS